jgi:hypothetical protein
MVVPALRGRGSMLQTHRIVPDRPVVTPVRP